MRILELRLTPIRIDFLWQMPGFTSMDAPFRDYSILITDDAERLSVFDHNQLDVIGPHGGIFGSGPGRPRVNQKLPRFRNAEFFQQCLQ